MFAHPICSRQPRWRPPDYESPFDRAAYVAQIPADVRVRGVTFASFARALGGVARAELQARRIRTFSWYSAAELIDYGCTVGETLYPELGTRAQMAAVWRTGFSGFRRESVLGRTLYALAGGTPSDLLRRGARIFENIHSHARIEIESERANELVLAYRDHWVVPETADASLLEGFFDALGFQTHLWIRPTGPAAGRVLIQWWPNREPQADVPDDDDGF